MHCGFFLIWCIYCIQSEEHTQYCNSTHESMCVINWTRDSMWQGHTLSHRLYMYPWVLGSLSVSLLCRCPYCFKEYGFGFQKIDDWVAKKKWSCNCLWCHGPNVNYMLVMEKMSPSVSLNGRKPDYLTPYFSNNQSRVSTSYNAFIAKWTWKNQLRNIAMKIKNASFVDDEEFGWYEYIEDTLIELSCLKVSVVVKLYVLIVQFPHVFQPLGPPIPPPKK